jgi:hypothetical protein
MLVALPRRHLPSFQVISASLFGDKDNDNLAHEGIQGLVFAAGISPYTEV